MASTIIPAAVGDRAGDTFSIMTGTRPVGAAVASAIAIVAAFVTYAIGHSDFLGLGVPAAAIAGWLLGPSVWRGGGLAGPTLGMGMLTVAIADALFVLGATATPSEAAAGAIGRYVALWVVGLVLVGIPMLIVTVPCGLLWVFIMRKLARDGIGRSRGNRAEG
jgi:hypothetical protein